MSLNEGVVGPNLNLSTPNTKQEEESESSSQEEIFKNNDSTPVLCDNNTIKEPEKVEVVDTDSLTEEREDISPKVEVDVESLLEKADLVENITSLETEQHFNIEDESQWEEEENEGDESDNDFECDINFLAPKKERKEVAKLCSIPLQFFDNFIICCALDPSSSSEVKDRWKNVLENKEEPRVNLIKKWSRNYEMIEEDILIVDYPEGKNNNVENNRFVVFNSTHNSFINEVDFKFTIRVCKSKDDEDCWSLSAVHFLAISLAASINQLIDPTISCVSSQLILPCLDYFTQS
jgi:hypothetical protein